MEVVKLSLETISHLEPLHFEEGLKLKNSGLLLIFLSSEEMEKSSREKQLY